MRQRVEEKRGEGDVHDESEHDFTVIARDDAEALQEVAEDGVARRQEHPRENRGSARGVHHREGGRVTGALASTRRGVT